MFQLGDGYLCFKCLLGQSSGLMDGHFLSASDGVWLFSQLFYLPAKKNVDSILEDYANYKKSRGNTDNK